jgi:hypothetical protein
VNEPGEISVARVIDLCRERDVRLAYEIGAFVVFEACEAVLAQPRAVRAADVWVSPEGATRVAQGRPADGPRRLPPWPSCWRPCWWWPARRCPAC